MQKNVSKYIYRNYFDAFKKKVRPTIMLVRTKNGTQLRRKPAKLNRIANTRNDIRDEYNEVSDKFSTKKHPKTKCNHIVRRFSIIIHCVQSQCYM